MLGAIAGDIIGSVFEWSSAQTRDFPLFSPRSDFTDDSVLTFAVARAILDARAAGSDSPAYEARILEFGRRYRGRGYGEMFREWLQLDEPRPYNSYGNGSAMRVSPVGFAFDEEHVVLEQARWSAMPTHDHPEGVKGAQSTALAVWMARRGASREEIRSRIESEFGYDLQRTVEEIQPGYSFDVTCQGSVPESIVAFLDAGDFEGAIRNAVWLGGDADTQACIAGGIAEAAWGVPAEIEEKVRERLPPELLAILDEFRGAFLPAD
ncbi:MAG TPA: ADP-ribosylglycohydrolase family protein [Gemmatimonadaceae bacterium]